MPPVLWQKVGDSVDSVPSVPFTCHLCELCLAHAQAKWESRMCGEEVFYALIWLEAEIPPTPTSPMLHPLYHQMHTKTRILFFLLPVQDPPVMKAPCPSSCCHPTCGCSLCPTWWCSGWRRPAPTGASCFSFRTRASLHSWVWKRGRVDASNFCWDKCWEFY